MANTTLAPPSNTTMLWRLDETLMVDKYTTPFVYIIGFPGNTISFIIWLRKRMRHSSGYYLAALALDDLIFLGCSLLFELQVTWGKNTLNYPFLCQIFPVVFVGFQFLSPLLVLAFTTERYISICHPFRREQYCTVQRAKIVIIGLTIFVFCLTSAQGYFYTLDTNYLNQSECTPRADILVGGAKSVFWIYNTCSELLIFLVVPVMVLVLNILVIREMRRLSKMEQAQLHGNSQRTGATTVMLLAVSFYQIITTLPITIVYAFYWEFDYGSSVPYYGSDRAGDRFRTYDLIMVIIKEYGITHYAFNIFIYVITGKMFREELKKLFLRPFCKLASRLPTNYSSLRTSIRGSERSTNWVSVNGKQDNGKYTGETLL